ncbi:Uncharacterised protein [Vibrio cholerae]|nr:Uncharacterised protein [Vibrio cholerae]CSB58152.1 Uncharacterised protein [Vibrio cholerae]CSB63498.1 Uncharacterised protein [Vibrio cholerae]
MRPYYSGLTLRIAMAMVFPAALTKCAMYALAKWRLAVLAGKRANPTSCSKMRPPLMVIWD